MINHNKTIAIMMVCVFCLSFLAPAFIAPSEAEAAFTATVAQSNNVTAAAGQNLGYIRVDVNVADWSASGVAYSQLLVSYPTRIGEATNNSASEVPVDTVNTDPGGPDGYGAGICIVVPDDTENVLTTASFAQHIVTQGGAFVISLTDQFRTINEKGWFYIYFSDMNTINYAGDVNVNLIPQAGTAFGTTPYSLVVGRVSIPGSTTAIAKSVVAITYDGGGLTPNTTPGRIDTITVFENMRGTISDNTTMTLTLVTNGCTWAGTPVGTGLFNFQGGEYGVTTNGSVATVTIPAGFTPDTAAGAISISGLQIAVDKTVAQVGQDIEVKVSGAGVTEQTIVIARLEGIPAAQGSISGQVTDIQANPIVGASVYADPLSGSTGALGSTDADGNYSITGLAGGTYSVSASADGWVSQSYNSNVSVTASHDTANINFTLQANTAGNTQVILTKSSPSTNVNNTPLQIIVPQSVSNASVTTTPAIAGGIATVTLPQINTTANTSLGNIILSIPDGTIVTGPSSWDGTINLPQVVNNSSVSVSGYTTTVGAAIELGLNDTPLTFSQPVRILLAGQGGKRAGWVRNSVFTPITYQMAADSAAALGANNDGYISNGNDMVIWTKHFTTFIAYTQTAISNGGGGGGGSASASYLPSLQTTAVTLITPDSAVLNGEIIANNGYHINDYGFLWGTNASNLTNKIQVGNDDHSGTFQAVLSGLKTGTKYYFQAYAANSYGTRKGTVMNFTTTSSQKNEITMQDVMAAPEFSDVDQSHWAYEYINILSNEGIVCGYPDGTFKPDQPITRAEFAAIMVKALGLDKNNSAGAITDTAGGD